MSRFSRKITWDIIDLLYLEHVPEFPEFSEVPFLFLPVFVVPPRILIFGPHEFFACMTWSADFIGFPMSAQCRSAFLRSNIQRNPPGNRHLKMTQNMSKRVYHIVQEISNRTHVSRTTKKPEYLITRSQLTERGPLGFGPIQFLMDIAMFQLQQQIQCINMYKLYQGLILYNIDLFFIQ